MQAHTSGMRTILDACKSSWEQLGARRAFSAHKPPERPPGARLHECASGQAQMSTRSRGVLRPMRKEDLAAMAMPVQFCPAPTHVARTHSLASPVKRTARTSSSSRLVSKWMGSPVSASSCGRLTLPSCGTTAVGRMFLQQLMLGGLGERRSGSCLIFISAQLVCWPRPSRREKGRRTGDLTYGKEKEGKDCACRLHVFINDVAEVAAERCGWDTTDGT